MFVDDLLFLFSQLVFFIFPLERVLLKYECLLGHILYHFLLFFLVFLPLGIQIFGSVDDGIFLTVKFLNVFSFFSLLLQKTNGLKRPLTYKDR